MQEITIEPILLSQHPTRGTRIATVLMTYPRFIHSEVLRHRVFASSVASSRAIPTKKMLAEVFDDPFVPSHWTLNKPGMQGDKVSLKDAPLIDVPGYHKKNFPRSSLAFGCTRWC